MAASLSSFSTLSLHHHHHHHHPSPRPHFSLHQHPTTSLSLQTPTLFSSSPLSLKPTITHCTPPDTIFFETELPEPNSFNPPDLPDDYSPSQTDDVLALTETEEDIAAAYEELYGPAYSGVSVLGNDINVMDKKFQKAGAFGKIRREKVRDEFDERVVQVRRVTKVVKGGKQIHFRVIVVAGDKKGKVGVGVGKAKEVIGAVQKAATDARRNVISIPLTKYMTFPHRSDGKYGAAAVMLRPASQGTGVIAGGSVRIVLEMAGVENALGKQLGSNNALNNARATIVAVLKMRQFSEVAEERGIPMEEMWK